MIPHESQSCKELGQAEEDVGGEPVSAGSGGTPSLPGPVRRAVISESRPVVKAGEASNRDDNIAAGLGNQAA